MEFSKILLILLKVTHTFSIGHKRVVILSDFPQIRMERMAVELSLLKVFHMTLGLKLQLLLYLLELLIFTITVNTTRAWEESLLPHQPLKRC